MFVAYGGYARIATMGEEAREPRQIIPKAIILTLVLTILLNLILGLSRVLLAMGRRLDMPRVLAHLNPSGTTPYVAVVAVEVAMALLILI